MMKEIIIMNPSALPLHPTESVRFILRKHPIVFMSLGFLAFVFACIEWTLFYFRDVFPIQGGIFWLVFFLLLLSFLLLLFVLVLREILHIVIFTNERVFAIRASSLLEHEIHESPLSHVTSIHADVRGSAEALFRCGTITIKNTDPSKDIVFSYCPDAIDITRQIHERMSQDLPAKN